MPIRALDAARDQSHASDEPPRAAEIVVRSTPGQERKLDCEWITTHLSRAIEAIVSSSNVRIASVSVLIVDDARMIELHKRHSGVAATTDVLTFDLRAHPSDSIEAELIVCADEAARRATEFNHSVERELMLYCVHGLLHCAGEDDHDETNWRRMHAREDEILTAIGVGATFSRDPRAGAGASKEDRSR